MSQYHIDDDTYIAILESVEPAYYYDGVPDFLDPHFGYLKEKPCVEGRALVEVIIVDGEGALKGHTVIRNDWKVPPPANPPEASGEYVANVNSIDKFDVAHKIASFALFRGESFEVLRRSDANFAARLIDAFERTIGEPLFMGRFKWSFGKGTHIWHEKRSSDILIRRNVRRSRARIKAMKREGKTADDLWPQLRSNN